MIEIGDKFYKIHSEITALKRQKLYKEFEGETWFRYDEPSPKYKLHECVIIGIVEKVLIGEWPGNEIDNYTEFDYYIQNLTTGEKTIIDDYYFTIRRNEKALFDTKEEAQARFNELVEEAKASELLYATKSE